MADKKKATKKAAKSEAKVVKCGDAYRVECVDGSGKLTRHSQKVPTKKEAEALLKEMS
jgi:hypothetical protein|tara:strand:- start:1094 stop:1267 length:174 start_codon:yes stop_codon:yes gene_type:complete